MAFMQMNYYTLELKFCRGYINRKFSFFTPCQKKKIFRAIFPASNVTTWNFKSQWFIYISPEQTSTEAWWLALLPHRKNVSGSNPSRDLSGFLPESKSMYVMLIGYSKLPIEMNVCGCLSTCGPWRPRPPLSKRSLISMGLIWLNKVLL